LRDFKKLDVWQVAHMLTLSVYSATRVFPRDEMYGLTSQVRRAATSVPANIAEGCGRDTEPDFARFLHMAMGSASELEYHLLLARELGYLSADEHEALNVETIRVKRMLTGLLRAVKADSRQPTADS
jgi:four helix bundle protein